MTEWDIIGHSVAVTTLRHLLAAGRLAHAYLITGPSGVGKGHLAHELALALMCDRRQAEQGDHACRVCPQCQRVLAGDGKHPDLHIVERQDDKRDIVIDQIRAMQEKIALHPFQAQRSVVILRDAHLLNEPAANALLKTLEEPSAHATLILTAGDVESVLPTISSRCQHIALRHVPAATIATALQERLNLTAAQARQIAGVSGGRPGYALAAATDGQILRQDEEVAARVAALCQANLAGRFTGVAEWLAGSNFNENRLLALDLLQRLLAFWRDVLVVAAGLPHRVAGNYPFNALERVAASTNEAAIVAALDRIRQALEDVEHNLTPRLVLENLMLRLPGPAMSRPALTRNR